jgi:hypothetical protein
MPYIGRREWMLPRGNFFAMLVCHGQLLAERLLMIRCSRRQFMEEGCDPGIGEDHEREKGRERNRIRW